MDLIDGCLEWHGNFPTELYEHLEALLGHIARGEIGSQ